MARRHDLLVTLEENALAGGAGCAVNECLAARHLQVPVLNLGLPDRFIEHGTRDEALRDAGLDRDGLRLAILARLAALVRASAHELVEVKAARRASVGVRPRSRAPASAAERGRRASRRPVPA